MKYLILLVFLVLTGCEQGHKFDLTGYNVSENIRVGEISTTLKTMNALSSKSDKEKDEDEYALDSFIFGFTFNLKF
jgi:Tfp pilus assembly protein PilP